MPRTKRQAKFDKERRTVVLDVELLNRLTPYAERRGIHRNELVRQLVEAALDSGTIEAVLDDG